MTKALLKLLGSSTFLASLILPVLSVVLERYGISIDPGVVVAGVGGYALKEAAGKVRAAHVAAPPAAASSTSEGF